MFNFAVIGGESALLTQCRDAILGEGLEKGVTPPLFEKCLVEVSWIKCKVVLTLAKL